MDIPSFKYNGKTNVWGNDKITFFYFCCKSYKNKAEIVMVIDNAGKTLRQDEAQQHRKEEIEIFKL